MLVSVIITTYNRNYEIVKRAIESVREQTYKKIEIIVTNDTPKENKLFQEVSTNINEYGDQITYIAEGINRGACYARNLGFEVSKGDYVAFLDDDDLWSKEKIEKQVDILNKTKFPMVTVGFESITLNNQEQEIKKELRVGKKSILNLNDILKKNIIGGASAPLIRREAFIKSGKFDINMPAAQDYDLWIRIAELGDVYYISEPLQKYYIYSGERISNSSSKKIKGYSKLLEKYSEIACNNRSFFTNKHIVLSYHYYNLEDNENGKSHFFSSVKSIPTTVDFVYYVLKIVKIRLSNKYKR